jgi:hypothetical protein
MMGHCKVYSDVSLQRLRWRVTGALKRLLWYITAKATMTDDGSLKRLLWWVTKKTTLTGDRALNQQWLNMHLNHVFLQLPIAMSLYKDMSSRNASSHFTHTLSLHSCTIFLNMSRYLISAWNECSFCHCGQWAKLATSLVPTTYGRRCWVCPDTTENGDVSFSILIW